MSVTSSQETEPALHQQRPAYVFMRIKAWLADHSDRSRAQRAAGIAFLIRVASAALLYVSQVLFARWMGSFEFGVYVYVWTWVLLLGGLVDLGIATGAQRFIPGIHRPQAARHAARIPLRQPLARARDGDRMGGARGARRVAVRRASAFLRDHAALHRLRRPAAVRARPPAGRHGALLRLDQSRADAALRDPLAAADRRDGRGLLAQAADRRLDRDARRGRHHLGDGDRPDAGDEPRGCERRSSPGRRPTRRARGSRPRCRSSWWKASTCCSRTPTCCCCGSIARPTRSRSTTRRRRRWRWWRSCRSRSRPRPRTSSPNITSPATRRSSPRSSPTRSSGRSGPRSPRPS